jgi:hypothetical protein
MSDIRTILGQIQAEQRRQAEQLDRIEELLASEPELDMDALLVKGMAMAEQRAVTAGMRRESHD